MKTDFLLKDFSDFEISNAQKLNLSGGGNYTGKVSGTGSINGQSTMDIALYDKKGKIVEHMCDLPDSYFGGLKPIGTNMGTF